jgi:hypothetical protein
MFKKKIQYKMDPKKNIFNPPKSFHEEKKMYSLALILDDEVQDIIRTEERLWALLVSGASIVDITDLEIQPGINWLYDEETDAFENPNQPQELEHLHEEGEAPEDEDKSTQ